MAKTWRFLPILKRVLKYFGIAMAVIFILFGIVSWIVVKNKNDWLLSQIQTYVNESQSGHLKIASTNFKIFRNFPDITIELDSIRYYEHPDSLRTPGEKPILYADQFFVALELFPLINEELKISDISLSKAQLNIIQYKNGKLNLELALTPPVKLKPPVVERKVVPKSPTATKPVKKTKPKPTTLAPAKAGIQIDMQSVSLNGVELIWNSYKNPKPSVIFLEELGLDLSNNENVVEATLSTTSRVQSLYIGRKSIPPGALTIQTEIQYDPSTQQLSLDTEVNYDELTATIQGTYEHQKNRLLNMDIDASSNDLELLSLFIKPEVLKQNPDLLKQADIYVKGKIAGELKTHLPQIDISFGLKNLDLNLPRNLGAFKDIGFDGSFSSGTEPDYSQARLELKKICGQLSGGFLKGEFTLNNFVNPYLKYNLDAQLKLDGYDEVFNLKSLKQLTGSVSLQANFDGPLKYFAQHSMDSARSSTLTLHDLAFVVTKTNLKVSGLSGTIENRNNRASIQQLNFNYGKNDLLLNATIDNFVYFLFKRDIDVSGSGSLQSKQLFTNDFLFDTTRTAYVQDRISNLDLNFQVKTSANKDTLRSGMPDIAFAIQKLSATLDKLPDIKLVTGKGMFSKTARGLKLDLHEFHATMPQGKLDVSGDLLIREKRLWEFNARVNTTKFPWTYVKELVAEIRTDQEPVAKNLSIKEMDLLTADLDISATVITYPFDFTKLIVRNSKADFHRADSKKLSVEKLNIALNDLSFIHPENSGNITGLKSTSGTIRWKQLKVPGLNPLDIDLRVEGKNDTLNIAFSSSGQQEKKERGNLFMDISQNDFMYQAQYIVEGARLEYFIQKFYKKNFMKGEINYTLNLTTHGPDWATIKQNLAGEIEIMGDSILLTGVDIDKALRKFERSQNFNLTDVGAVLIAGPVGLAVTKGSDFASLATVNLNPKHHTNIQKLQATWRLENQQLITKDVAIATHENRIVFNGRIDFAHDSIPGLTIAVVDKNGCSLMDQKLYGKTTSLKTGKLNITKTLFGSVINFVNVIVGKDCKPVYTGKVKAPVQ